MGHSVVLNANQRRHFEVLFAGLEASLAKIEATAAAQITAGVYTALVPDLPPGFLAGATPVIETMRGRLARLRTELGLVAHPVSQRQVCRALVTAEIIRIEESQSASLRGYGAVDPTVAAGLDPVLHELRASLRTLAGMLTAPVETRT